MPWNVHLTIHININQDASIIQSIDIGVAVMHTSHLYQ